MWTNVVLNSLFSSWIKHRIRLTHASSLWMLWKRNDLDSGQPMIMERFVSWSFFSEYSQWQGRHWLWQDACLMFLSVTYPGELSNVYQWRASGTWPPSNTNQRVLTTWFLIRCGACRQKISSQSGNKQQKSYICNITIQLNFFSLSFHTASKSNSA